ncbi:hypothetical protein NQ314_004261 [Rhamnusium bicolor]|uniref:Uncharacterized protein n=1 Tax=Rhamnusium bicolor TaxID=1586634 RepID=A0AAV8ZKE8_9CUCU|nr:hypothetical protein NQ314_004261 [Rhamnusium bicolor]
MKLKVFTKLLKETVRQNSGSEVHGRAEVISAIRNIQNKDEVFAVLTRANKNMNKHGIKFVSADGKIKLNGIDIDMNEFMSMNKKNAETFLSKLSKSDPTPVETRSMRKMISNTLNNFSLPDIGTLVSYAVILLNCYDNNIKSKIIDALASLLASFTSSIKKNSR